MTIPFPAVGGMVYLPVVLGVGLAFAILGLSAVLALLLGGSAS